MSYERTCKTCQSVFDTSDVRRLYCDSCRTGGIRSRNPARRQTRQQHVLRFVGVDGEGVDRPDGTHDYVMLSVGDRTLFKAGERLGLRDILSFLWECHTADPGATYVGFFLGYDFVQWLGQLPERQAHFLYTQLGIASRTSQRVAGNPFPDPVVWQGWEFDIMAGRRFKLRPHVHQRSLFDDACRNRTCDISMADSIHDVGRSRRETLGYNGSWPTHSRSSNSNRSHSWLYICDTGSFWQTSFVNVIDPKNWGDDPVCTSEEFEAIVRGKNQRGLCVEPTDTSYRDDMVRYNTLENRILAKVTERLNRGFMNDAIPIRIKRNEWFGPGRAAQSWMDLLHTRVADPVVSKANRANGLNHRTPVGRLNEHGILNADIYLSVPPWFTEAARNSYYGGWFEIPVHGHCGDLWEYDINSAYPYVISTLPCLHTDQGHDGIYSRGSGDTYPVGEYTLLHGRFEGSDPFLGALPFRTKTGNILRPHVTEGWYWLHEVDAARRAGLVNSISVETWYSFRPCSCSPPFDPTDIGITRMYNLRLQVGKNTPAGKAFKLVYNSAYGKTAQSVGRPKYANPVYASLITAGCRTLILEAIASHPLRSSGVAMVATDGVYFVDRHPMLSLSATALGGWDQSFRENMTLLMPGVYWDDNTREMIGAGVRPKMKSRGVAARDLADNIVVLDRLFAEMYEALASDHPYTWPAVDLNVRMQIVSAKLALHRRNWASAGRIEHNVKRRLSANPESKRQPAPYLDGGMIRTRPYSQWSTVQTTPYHRSFGYLDLTESDGHVGIDGRDPLDPIRDILHT